MISYSRIGHFGRLGNQLFQFASTLGIGRKLGYEVFFPEENVSNPSIEDFRDGIRRPITFDIPKWFNIDHLLLPKVKLKIKYEAQEPSFEFSDRMFTIPDDTDLIGYYQSERYFSHIEKELKDRALVFRKEILSEAQHKMPNNGTERISIHLRVGDYIGLSDFHPIMTTDYYTESLKWFDTESTPYTFVIFSDGITLAKQMFGEGENVVYVEGNSDIVDLCMMTLCEHNIIANSSFSWWGAWLGNEDSKIVIAPKNWFADKSALNPDLIPDRWYKI